MHATSSAGGGDIRRTDSGFIAEYDRGPQSISYIWEVATGECVATHKKEFYPAFCLAVLDGGRLARGSLKIDIYDPALSDVLR